MRALKITVKLYSPDSVQRIRSKTSTNGDTPSEEERGEERALEGTDENDGLQGVVHTEARR